MSGFFAPPCPRYRDILECVAVRESWVDRSVARQHIHPPELIFYAGPRISDGHKALVFVVVLVLTYVLLFIKRLRVGGSNTLLVRVLNQSSRQLGGDLADVVEWGIHSTLLEMLLCYHPC